MADIIGTGGRLKSERLAEMNQNGWPIEIGMGGRNRSENACMSERPGFHLFVSSNGACLHWYSNGTICFQGPPFPRQELEEKLDGVFDGSVQRAPGERVEPELTQADPKGRTYDPKYIRGQFCVCSLCIDPTSGKLLNFRKWEILKEPCRRLGWIPASANDEFLVWHPSENILTFNYEGNVLTAETYFYPFSHAQRTDCNWVARVTAEGMTHDDVVKHYAHFLEHWNSNARVTRAFIDDEQSMLVLKTKIRDGFSHDTEQLSFLLELFDRDLNEFVAETKPLSINEVRALTGKEPIVYVKEVKST